MTLQDLQQLREATERILDPGWAKNTILKLISEVEDKNRVLDAIATVLDSINQDLQTGLKKLRKL